VLTFDVTKLIAEPPKEAERFVVARRIDRDLRQYLSPSPYIESGDPRLRSIASEIVDAKSPAWEQVEAIYDWVRSNIRYQFNPQIKSGLQALEDGVGDCEELTSLFVALCRASKIPARSVWVPNHCYPEFYLLDEQGIGHWIPCQAAGEYDFGRIRESRPILQKGDNFRVQGHRQPLRYVQPTLMIRNTTAPPTLEWIARRVEG
jgi:hypothetical protein